MKKSSNSPQVAGLFCSDQIVMMIPNVLQAVLVVVLLVLSAGCSKPTAVDSFDNYLTRLARVLDRDRPEWLSAVEASLAVKYPNIKGRRLAVTDTRVGLFDFLSLGECDLLHLVSERNSSLGKFMSAPARYQYEWLLLHGLQQCLERAEGVAEGEQERVAKLTDIVRTKQQELPLHYWNATWGSSEFQQFFSLSHSVLTIQEVSGVVAPATQGLQAYFSALPRLTLNSSTHEEKVTADSSLFAESYVLEGHLQPLQYHYGGRLIKSLAVATQAIQSANQLLKSRLAERQICINQKASRTAEILHNVFVKYYVLELQPYLSRLDKEAAALRRVLHTHQPTSHPRGSDAVKRFYRYYFMLDQGSFMLDQGSFMVDQGRDLLLEMRAALQEHARIWNQLLHDCGIEVGGRV